MTPRMSQPKNSLHCIRYVNNYESGYGIVENFLKFMPIDRLTGENLAKTMLRGFEECGLDLKCLWGQG